MGNDDLVAERCGAVAHDGGSGLSCCHVLMRAAVVSDLDGLIIRHPEVDSHNPATTPLAQFARPLMRQHKVGSDRHRIHASCPEASGFRLDACALDATQELGGCEVHKSSHAHSIWTHKPQVKKAAQLGCGQFRNGL